MLAALAPDGTSLRLLVANLAVAHSSDVNGQGVPHTVHITLTGGNQHASSTASMWSFDATTDPGQPVAAHSVPVSLDGSGQAYLQLTLAGYGVAIVQIPLR
jgi:hypothetical protein